MWVGYDFEFLGCFFKKKNRKEKERKKKKKKKVSL
jgi:hypothetical protein